MRIACILIRQRQHDQIRRLTRRQAARLIGPPQRFGAAERGHAEDVCGGNLGVAAMDEAGLFEDAEIGVGGEAIGAERDTNAARQEFAKWVRRMAEGGVGARAVDDSAVRRDGRLRRKVVGVDIQYLLRRAGQLDNIRQVERQSSRIPGAALGQKRDEGAKLRDGNGMRRRQSCHR